MKNISAELKTHISGEVTTLATCWHLERRDGVVLGFTDHDNDLVVEALTYKAATGFTPSAVQTTSSFAVDNLDIEGMLDSSAITENDIMAGLYDYAEIEVFMVNYIDLTQGKMNLRSGWLGEVSFSQNRFVTEVRGLTQSLAQKIGDVFSPTCRALLGDARCKIDLEDFTFEAEVTGVIDKRVFSASSLVNPTEFFSAGKIKFTSGANLNLEMEVKDYVLGGNIALVLPLPYVVEVGDEFEIVAGCDKSFNTCIDKFENAVNFHGEPHVPGMDAILQTAGTI